MEIARRIAEQIVRPKTSDVRKNFESFRNRTNKSTEANQTVIPENKHKTLHRYQSNRPVKNHLHQSVTSTSPPMPMHPPLVRPRPAVEDITTDDNYKRQQRAQQRWFERNSAHIRPHNLRFPYAVTPRSNNIKSFFHQSTNEQSPTSTVSETIWFAEMDPRNLDNSHSSEYNPLLSYRIWANVQFDSKLYNFVKASLQNLKYRVSVYFPVLPSENKNTVKRSTKNMGRDKIHQTSYPILKQFYSLTERFFYDYDYEFKLPLVCTFDHLVAKASQDLSAYSVINHELFQLSYNFLHPKPKEVQNNNYRVHKTKLIHFLIYYTFFRDTVNYTKKLYSHQRSTYLNIFPQL